MPSTAGDHTSIDTYTIVAYREQPKHLAGTAALAASATQKGLSRQPIVKVRFGVAKVCGRSNELLEERVRQVAPQQQAARYSAAAYSFARSAFSFVCVGVDEYTHHYSTLLRRGGREYLKRLGGCLIDFQLARDYYPIVL